MGEMGFLDGIECVDDFPCYGNIISQEEINTLLDGSIQAPEDGVCNFDGQSGVSKNGVFIFDKPYRVNCIDFICKHTGHSFIMRSIDGYTAEITAVAWFPDLNDALQEYYESQGEGQGVGQLFTGRIEDSTNCVDGKFGACEDGVFLFNEPFHTDFLKFQAMHMDYDVVTKDPDYDEYTGDIIAMAKYSNPTMRRRFELGAFGQGCVYMSACDSREVDGID